MQSDLPLSIQLVWLIPIYGLSGMLLSLPWAAGWFKRQGPRPAAYLNLLMTLLGVIHGSLVLRQILQLGAQRLQFDWFAVADLKLQIGFELSLTNLSALEFVTAMSLLGQVFALGYLDKEWSLARFYALLGFFEGAMAGLVLSSNLFVSYFLLEMLTLSTYLLVGFWYAQPLVVTAARDAFLTKRVGDVMLLMGMVALSAWAGSLEFNDLYEWGATATATGALTPLAGTLIGLGLIAGPMGKCAQFPMHLWLDEAMEGPNPASILRNSAVVTCGALVLLKLMPLLQFSPLAVDVLLVVGTISAIGGALVAIAQVDLKRAFSYGTSSYLGLVFIAIALQQPAVALLLLFAHGLAKALIFMGVGSVIATTNCQDLTELGGLGSRMPATTSAFLVAGAGLTGLLPLGCFWCFGFLVQAFLPNQPFLAAVVLITNGLTAFNLVRVYRQVFLDTPHPKTRRAPEVNWLMALPMVSLTVIVLLLPLMFQRLNPVAGLSAVNSTSIGLVVASGALGVLAGSLVRLDRFWSRSVLKPLRALQDLLAYDFYTDKLYRATIVRLVAGFADLTNRFDQEVITGLANRLGLLSMQGAQGLKLAVSGQMQTYVLTAVLAIVLLLGSLIWSLG
ncbi:MULTISPECIES: NAD(P)H-quinone oxidoreductase subunit F [Synechococcus]|jgi:NAD(P)H-quinone oxidoreductase subunit 5|uniref:NAD(P)H-quinone oxidoreductase subunit F n=1 Tax=Synechococcus TaxID=1129 RepID=UPI0020CE42EB|nr:NAD(P)H-quinone oxidoreductase subunit F [Synechococcus lacustris]MCP9814505.1 NAD(P)H-quinone oxidoreductase subunit F [Synechococcus lacustris L1E-Slac]MCP9924059.1 NAD(P)H-quinone oxidoreductase subunit F [Synechococcus lacustris C3-12m-Tous]